MSEFSFLPNFDENLLHKDLNNSQDCKDDRTYFSYIPKHENNREVKVAYSQFCNLNSMQRHKGKKEINKMNKMSLTI